MTCRVCLLDVKKTAQICGQCSLISHSKCTPNAPPTCDLRAQLLLFAQYAEKGNPASVYSNPAAKLNNLGNNTKQNLALSDVAFVEHSRTSLDGQAMTTTPPTPPAAPATAPAVVEHQGPTAFKFMAAFKRSRSNLTPEPASSLNNDEDSPGHHHHHGGATKPAAMQRLIKRSFGALHHPSSPTHPSSPPPPPPPILPLPSLVPAPAPESVVSCNSSLRSAATANESFSSRQNTGRRSQVSSPVSGGSGSGGRSGSGVGYYGDVQRRKSNSTVAVLETVPGSRPTTSGVRREEMEGEEEEGEEEGESVIEIDETRVPGGFEPKKRRRGGSSGCMVQ